MVCNRARVILIPKSQALDDPAITNGVTRTSLQIQGPGLEEVAKGFIAGLYNCLQIPKNCLFV